MHESTNNTPQNEPAAAPEASQSLGQKISLTLETKRLMSEIEKEVYQLDWDIKDLAPLDAAPRLAAPAQHLLAAGGKRIRPLIICILGKALNLPFQKLSTYALASELVHTATLLHDDILDEAQTRRGRITAHLKFDAHTAILSGDALLSKAISDVACEREPEIVQRLAMTVREVVEGECLQADLEGKVHEELDSVLEVCRRKTGALFAWGTWTAGYVAGQHAEELRKFGRHLGLAFQLLDDVLDWESKETGKTEMQDLSEAKLNSVAVLLCMKSRKARNILEEAFAGHKHGEQIEKFQEIGLQLKALKEYSESIQWVKERAEKESAFALANLDVLPEGEWKALIQKITTDLLKRMS